MHQYLVIVEYLGNKMKNYFNYFKKVINERILKKKKLEN